MPTDAELRRLFRDTAAPASSIDVASVIRRSKRRRLPQQVGAGSVMTLAVAGIGVAGFTGVKGLMPMTTSADLAEDSPVGMTEAAPFADTGGRGESAGDCIPASPTVAPPLAGIDATALLPATATIGQDLTGTITIRNATDRNLDAVALPPTVTLGVDGAPVWYAVSGATGRVPIDLAAGSSTQLELAFPAIGCDATTDAPTVAPGRYELRVRLDVVLPDGSTRSISSPAGEITLR